MQLNYEPASDGRLKDKSAIFHVKSSYQDDSLKAMFLELKANVCDLNPALLTKCITGTEQDFIMLMKRAKEYVDMHFWDASSEMKENLLSMFSDAVFGYYVLTPLILSKEVSDIKVLGFDHVVVKANGERFVADVSFYSEEDYKNWYERILRIQRLGKSEEYSLGHCTDRKGVEEFYLRIDVQLPYITSTERANIHIRKMPKEKLSWDYLKENGMLDDSCMEYLKDRILADYGFLISGRGGSGKSTLLNNMLDWIPFNQSILVSQESDELYSNIHPQMQFEHTMTVKKQDAVTEFSLEDELRLGLLQDIDNFVIGEIKGDEAEGFSMASYTGHKCWATVHGMNSFEGINKLIGMSEQMMV